MGNNCCVREDYIDENLLYTKNIDEILEVIEERNLDFLLQHIEIGNYLSGKSDYLSIQFMVCLYFINKFVFYRNLIIILWKRKRSLRENYI